MESWRRIFQNDDYWVSDHGNVKYGDDKISLRDLHGYRYVYLSGHGSHRVHRLVWSTFKGEIPDGMQIDHKDRVRDNNHLANIRVGTPSQNQANRPRQCNNTSGLAGIGRKWGRDMWRARVKCRGKTYEKTFKTTAEAERWRLVTKRDLFGDWLPYEDKKRIKDLRL